MKVVHFHQEREGDKKIKNFERFKPPISTVRNIIAKRKKNGAAEVKARSGRPIKTSDKMA